MDNYFKRDSRYIGGVKSYLQSMSDEKLETFYKNVRDYEAWK
jgi:hypothetical protein